MPLLSLLDFRRMHLGGLSSSLSRRQLQTRRPITVSGIWAKSRGERFLPAKLRVNGPIPPLPLNRCPAEQLINRSVPFPLNRTTRFPDYSLIFEKKNNCETCRQFRAKSVASMNKWIIRRDKIVVNTYIDVIFLPLFDGLQPPHSTDISPLRNSRLGGRDDSAVRASPLPPIGDNREVLLSGEEDNIKTDPLPIVDRSIRR